MLAKGKDASWLEKHPCPKMGREEKQRLEVRHGVLKQPLKESVKELLPPPLNPHAKDTNVANFETRHGDAHSGIAFQPIVTQANPCEQNGDAQENVTRADTICHNEDVAFLQICSNQPIACDDATLDELLGVNALLHDYNDTQATDLSVPMPKSFSLTRPIVADAPTSTIPQCDMTSTPHLFGYPLPVPEYDMSMLYSKTLGERQALSVVIQSSLLKRRKALQQLHDRHDFDLFDQETIRRQHYATCSIQTVTRDLAIVLSSLPVM
jgi:hypothetical protein